MTTQKNIAHKLGLSISLVSRVLSGKAKDIGIAAETIDKVLEEAQRTNYTPNSAALTLRGTKTHTLGVVTYDFGDPYFGFILGELHKIARARKFSLILAGSYQRDADALDFSTFVKHNVEGLIIVGSDRKKDWFKDYIDESMPVVQIGRTHDMKGSNICLDESVSAEMVAEYLKNKGVATAALIFGDSLTSEVFRAAHLEALGNHGINITGDIVTDNSDRSINAATRKLRPLPDVIIAADDLMAIQIIRSLYESGVSVPEDVKVIGFDNIPNSRNFIPALTTLNPPIKEMVQMAFDLASVPETSNETIKFAPELISRESG